MITPRMRALVVLVLVLAAAAGASAWRPSVKLADTRQRVELDVLFPKAFGGWTLDDRVPVQLVSPDAQAVLDKIYNQTLSRTYTNAKGERVMLSVAYGGDQSDATRAHRPEVCYPAQGFQIRSGRGGQLDLDGQRLPVRQLVAGLGGRIEPITYWITVGEKVTVTGMDQKLAQLSYSMRGTIPDGMLVRVSNIDANPDSTAAFSLHKAFLSDLSRAMAAAQRPRVFGRGDA